MTRLERLGARFRAPEAILGIVTALAADSPEIATAVTALARGQRDVSVGVLLGSNVLNLAALLGLSTFVAGRIALHRRVVAFEGVVAVWVASMTVALVAGWLSPVVGLGLTLALVVPYLFVSALPPARRRNLPLPRRWRDWLAEAVKDEELALSSAIPPTGAARGKTVGLPWWPLTTVVGASVAMEWGATALGARLGLSSIILGAVVLAAATSFPNAVAAVYLASRGRGPAALAEATNSNTLNVVVGLLVPAVILGAGKALGCRSDRSFVVRRSDTGRIGSGAKGRWPGPARGWTDRRPLLGIRRAARRLVGVPWLPPRPQGPRGTTLRSSPGAPFSCLARTSDSGLALSPGSSGNPQLEVLVFSHAAGRASDDNMNSCCPVERSIVLHNALLPTGCRPG